MSPELYWIASTFPGRLAVAARPRGGDWLADDLAGLRQAGVDILVSTLRRDELVDLDLLDEVRAGDEAGLVVEEVPIFDRSVPELGTSLPILVRLAQELRSGRNVAVHCRMGIGRSPLVAASLLVVLGGSPEAAWASIEAARGRRVPDTEEQREWVRVLGQRLK